MSGIGISRRPERYCAGDRVGVVEQALDRTGVDDLAAVLARARADVDDPVGRGDGVLVVLDDDEGVAEVAQPRQRLDQPVVVALVQPDRRLVQDVEHADQARADLGGQPDALGLAAGQRAGRPVEREVVQADVEQEAQPGLDLLDHPLGDCRSRSVKSTVVRNSAHSLMGSAQTSRDVPAADEDRQDLRLEPGALACGARHLTHVALVALPAPVRVGLGVPALDERARRPRTRWCTNARGRSGCGTGRGPCGSRRAAAPPWPAPAAPARARPGRSLRSSASAADDPQEVVGRPDALAPRARSRPRRSTGPRRARAARGPPRARCRCRCTRAGAERAVERERARLDLVDGQRVVVGAGHLLGEAPLPARGSCGIRSTSTNSTSSTPPARPSAVSTESVSRRLAPDVARRWRRAGRRPPRWCA